MDSFPDPDPTDLGHSLLVPDSLRVTEDGGVGESELPTGTVTLLLTDIESSTRMWEAREEAASAALSGDFDAVWAEGTALDVAEVVAYTSRARGERKRPSAGWESLTPTEERVVTARGTVKVHLAHVFTKLGVSTRAELATAVTRRAMGRPSG